MEVRGARFSITQDQQHKVDKGKQASSKQQHSDLLSIFICDIANHSDTKCGHNIHNADEFTSLAHAVTEPLDHHIVGIVHKCEEDWVVYNSTANQQNIQIWGLLQEVLEELNLILNTIVFQTLINLLLLHSGTNLIITFINLSINGLINIIGNQNSNK